jgi:oxygen-independent coproporphyrinogen-3 oxidase
MSLAGIYLHLPFCVHRCSYCSFVVSTEDNARVPYIAALLREIAMLSGEAAGAEFDTVYFGGGTPSALPHENLQSLLQALHKSYRIGGGVEITAEANPDDVRVELLRAWRDAGVTRVSLGVQSLHDVELASIERRHGADQARRARDACLRAGFDVSCDLLLGIPSQTAETFLSDVGEMAGSGVGHLSVYLLEMDKAPRLAEERRRQPGRFLSEEAQADAYLAAGTVLGGAGFEHYEVSNWARPGCRARHNAKYWRRIPTLGFGVSAHEFWAGRRRANTDSLGAYVSALGEGKRPTVLDRKIGPEETLREKIVLSARTSEGISQRDLEQWRAGSGDPEFPGDWESWLALGLLRRRGQSFAFTEKGFLLSNEILCRFV